MMARFDFSKANEIYYEEHPEWFYRSLKGETVNYNGQVHTCVNGAYQQEYSIKILREALSLYALDAVFFNMFGFQTRDYGGVYHGICQCANCVRSFKEYSGKPLPKVEDSNDPIFREYQKFQRKTVNDMLDRIADTVKSFGEEIAICTYATHRIDLVRSESNSGVDRRPSTYVYSASDNTRFVTGAWPDKAPSNSAVHFVDIPYRYVGVSPHLTELRLIQNIANGGGPDYYVIGTLDQQMDRTANEGIKRWFDYHKEHEELYSGRRPAANIALLAFNRHSSEYRGLFTMLSEEHILFQNLDPNVLEVRPDALDAFEAVILPGPVHLSEEWGKRLDGYVEKGGKLIVTQEAYVEAGPTANPVVLQSLGVEAIVNRRESMRSAYFELAPSEVFEELDGLDVTFLDGPYRYVELSTTAVGMMPLIPPHMYGPPEKCYYTQITENPGLISNAYGQGATAYMPWNIGDLYNTHQWHGHRRVFAAVLDSVLGVSRTVMTDAPEALEFVLLTKGASWMNCEDDWLLQLINLSGYTGVGYYAPHPIFEVNIAMKVPQKPSELRLTDGSELPFSYEDAVLSFKVPQVESLQGVVIRW